MASRPTYRGIPDIVQSEITARRQIREERQAPTPPAAAVLPAGPFSIEARLSAVEKQLATLTDRIDLVLDLLGVSGDTAATVSANPRPAESKPKR